MNRTGVISAGAAAALVVGLGVLAGLQRGPSIDDALVVEFTPEERRRVLSMSPVPDPPPDPTNRVADDPAAAHLGQFLFFETRLSSNNAVSCSTCHDPNLGFADGLPIALGVGRGKRHSPSLFNVAHNRWFFWDGRADTLWSQALSPIETPFEMESTRTDIARLMSEDDELRAAYQDVFGELPDLSDTTRFPPRARPRPDNPDHPQHTRWTGMTEADRRLVNEVFVNVGKAIAAYERRIITPPSPFDEFVAGLERGDGRSVASLGESAQRGLKLFVGAAGCFNCHSGPMLSDGEFHNNRVAPLDDTREPDAGRYEGIALLAASEFSAGSPFSDDPDGPRARLTARVAQSPENWGRFKTPSLRNVSRTAPYMHQGQKATLEAVVRHYSTFEDATPPSHHALPDPLLQDLELSDQQIADLVAFLESLTSPRLPRGLTKQPESAVYRP